MFNGATYDIDSSFWSLFVTNVGDYLYFFFFFLRLSVTGAYPKKSFSSRGC